MMMIHHLQPTTWLAAEAAARAAREASSVRGVPRRRWLVRLRRPSTGRGGARVLRPAVA